MAYYQNSQETNNFDSHYRKFNVEYQKLLAICRKRNISNPRELSWFITQNRIGYMFPTLTGDVEFSSGGTLENGISPAVYGCLCYDLGFERQNKNRIYVTKFTPNGAKRAS